MKLKRKLSNTGPRMATSISFASCEHGSVFIRLHGFDGEIFAAGCMTADVGAAMVEQLNDVVGEALSGTAPACGQVH